MRWNKEGELSGGKQPSARGSGEGVREVAARERAILHSWGTFLPSLGCSQQEVGLDSFPFMSPQQLPIN